MATEEVETIEFQTSVIIPDTTVTGGESAQGEPSPKSLAQQLEEAKLDAKKSAEALDDLISGIRAVKRILDNHADDDEKESAKEESIVKDEELIANLSDRLPGILGSDLMALVNAANMARGHAKLASDEAASAVSEMQEARKEAEESNTKARTAAKISKKLYEDNLVLQQQVVHLKKERRTLVKAVKDLQQEQEQTSRFDTWRLLEEHVQNSVTIHEMILKTPTRGTGKKSFFDSAHESTRSMMSDDGSHFTNAPASVEKPKKFGRISPTPTASCSEDSMSYQKHEGGSTPASVSEDQENVGMPTDVSLVKPRPTSPLGTPIISREGNGNESQELKPICNPNILRTLAIPGDERMDGRELPSPRVRIAPGLYEV
eukprot:CAMPEP_0113660734 /NCGR_PEP_ID=MMETSP0017_2-20120614/33060_1 /TAXON_ID=2856 /ORGANISM="Cylindrotheca closterium" /LENGTH=373 /DNA_ID=CAMNT_0000575393 /DNA_START=89 /DNA_END=1210 /DNA_ORIENTATION=- /assembly_acc=CAM_ASM_000147